MPPRQDTVEVWLFVLDRTPSPVWLQMWLQVPRRLTVRELFQHVDRARPNKATRNFLTRLELNQHSFLPENPEDMDREVVLVPYTMIYVYTGNEQGFDGVGYSTRRNKAATAIQAAWRGRKARSVANDLRYRPGGPAYLAARNRWAASGGGVVSEVNEYAARARAALDAVLARGLVVRDATRRKFTNYAQRNTFTPADKRSIRALERRALE